MTNEMMLAIRSDVELHEVRQQGEHEASFEAERGDLAIVKAERCYREAVSAAERGDREEAAYLLGWADGYEALADLDS